MKNKTLKSIMATLLSVAMLMSFAACGDSSSESSEKKDSAGSSASDNSAVNSNVTKILDENVKVGDYVIFGTYEQNNDTSNGAEDIEWLVLKVNNGTALLISKYGLDCQKYNEHDAEVTWQNCTLRKWLNNDFYNTAFSENEKSLIKDTIMVTDNHADYITETQDKVFLLDIDQANSYLGSNEERMCKPTAYAIDQGAYHDSSNGNCWWWLRSPVTNSQTSAAYIYSDGIVSEDGCYVGSRLDNCYGTIRPVMWVKLGETNQ